MRVSEGYVVGVSDVSECAGSVYESDDNVEWWVYEAVVDGGVDGSEDEVPSDAESSG